MEYEDLMKIAYSDASRHFINTQKPFVKEYEVNELGYKLIVKITYIEHIKWERYHATVH